MTLFLVSPLLDDLLTLVVYYYNDLNSLEPMSTDILDQQLGQTRKYTLEQLLIIQAMIHLDPRNVPNTVESLYGE